MLRSNASAKLGRIIFTAQIIIVLRVNLTHMLFSPLRMPLAH
jgi:hypothetical protein